MSVFARPFRITFPDGVPEDEVWHGVQFPDGRCVLAVPFAGFDIVTGFEHLDQAKSDGAVVEWADGGKP